MTWIQDYEFREPLQDLRGAGWEHDLAERLTNELRRELGLGCGHVLHGRSWRARSWRVIARALPNDDVVAVCDDDVAVVHLTWSPGSPPATLVQSFEELEGYVADKFGDWEP